MSETSPSSTIRSLQHSQLFRVSAIAFLILLLQIPISMIRTTIREREGNRDQAARAIAESWGDEQRVVGPRLVVPYVTTQEVTHGDGRVRTESTIHYIHVLADTLGVTGTLVSEARYRGIFQVPVFRTHLHFQGVFRRPDVAALDIDPGSIMWDRAVLAMGISDADAIPRQVSVQWNGHTVDFLPGMGWPGSGEGIHAPLGRAARTDEVAFDLSVSVNGTGGVFVVPFGSETRVTLEGDWPDPSFEGTWLPEEREVTAEGFTALWNVPFLGRNYPQQWSSAQGVPDATISASAFGVRLLAPVDHYRMSHRSVKYQFLFLVLTFVSIWLFEVLAG
ncbi:MAG: cell envelope integrity protein CreD, partial [Gemmatimonadota bacterium]|nr:cell envelope integrity protein CreD [Gemmatimonadota bacterium]